MRKKVAIVLHGLQLYTGAEVLFFRLSSFIDPKKVELTFLIAVDPDDPQDLEKNVISNGANVIHLHDLDRGRIIRWPWTLYHALKKYGPFDVVHSNMDMQSGAIAFIAKLAGIPLRICHAHAPGHVHDWNGLFRKLYVHLMRFCINKYSNIRLACSENAGKYFYGNSTFYRLYNGIDLSKYNNAINRHLIDAPRYRFITVGRFAPEKNPLFLLDVFTALHDHWPDSQLTWVGSGRLLDEIQQKSKERGLTKAIIFTGKRWDVDSVLAHSDFFLFPSIFEAFGVALLEAQAAGLDCFASDTIPRLVDCGKCQFLSLDLSPAEWADRIIRYIESGSRMTLDQDKLHQFDIRVMGSKLTELYVTGSFPSE